MGTSAQAQSYQPLPPLRQETIPPMPRGGRYVWRPGHWRWDGREYIWIPGEYVRYSPEYRHWEHGHWVNRGGVWVWIEPRWR